MRTRIKKMAVTLFAVSALGLVSGCADDNGSKDHVAPVPSMATCDDIMSYGISNFSKHEVINVLEGELRSGQDIHTCWLPVVNAALNANLKLPQAQLKEVLKRLNSGQYEEVFNEAVFQYLGNIARGEGPYRRQEKELLKGYCSYIINNARFLNNRRLGEVQLLTKRLDPTMYAKFFENN